MLSGFANKLCIAHSVQLKATAGAIDEKINTSTPYIPPSSEKSAWKKYLVRPQTVENLGSKC